MPAWCVLLLIVTAMAAYCLGMRKRTQTDHDEVREFLTPRERIEADSNIPATVALARRKDAIASKHMVPQPPGTVIGWYCLGANEIHVVVTQDGLTYEHINKYDNPTGYCSAATDWPHHSRGTMIGETGHSFLAHGSLRTTYSDGQGGWYSFDYRPPLPSTYGSGKPEFREIEMRPLLDPALVKPQHGAYY